MIVGEVVLSLKLQACIRGWWWKRSTSISKSFCKAIVCAISLNFVTPGGPQEKKTNFIYKDCWCTVWSWCTVGGSHLYIEKVEQWIHRIAWRRGRGSNCFCYRLEEEAAVVEIDALDQGTFLLNFVSDEKGFVSNFDITTIGKVTANDDE
jgi:hypothetical protein